MILPIRYAGDPILYKKCKEVPLKQFSSAKIQTFLNDYAETLVAHNYAAGLAAPQVGKNYSIFALNLPEDAMTYTTMSPSNFRIPASETFFFINPKISFPTIHTDLMEEGCLSIPKYYGVVERYKTIEIEAYTRDGEHFKISAAGVYARYIQHEFDHLNGILWFDRVADTQDILYTPDAPQ